MHDKLLLLHKLLNEITEIENEDTLTQLTKSYQKKLGVSSEEDALQLLLSDTEMLGRELLLLKSHGVDLSRSKKLAAMTEEERTELAETEKIIDENRFNYHFQPIVNAADGTIYSYEALMRPTSDMRLSPFHILKYAELLGRMTDIERATFLNVLGIIDSSTERFKEKKVFINSIPKVKLNNNDLRRVGELLLKHSDTAVVEFTEYAESDEEDLTGFRERYQNMGVKMAIDDYGTGYSNVKNLLRYMPHYVKIDRSLISDIQNNPKKRHFVREIIEFCHSTDIMALAEGVETFEEMRAVILLGVDLIQGYYTAKPAAQIVDSIPYEIIQEIKLCQQERQDGREHHVYAAEAVDRIQLDKLAKDGYKCIFVGKTAEKENKVTIIGSPSLDTEISVVVAKNYKGDIVLENAHLSNVKNRPCIDLSEHSEVTLTLNGENKLVKSGIRVPKSAKLTLEGEGLLDIQFEAAEYFGIGNDITSEHGELIFNQMGKIEIHARGKTGTCIGSGMGGAITVNRGKINLIINGHTGVGIGALYGDSNLEINNCAIDAEISLMNGVAIGSYTGCTKVNIWKASTKLFMSGKDASAIGTLRGNSADITINDALVMMNVRSPRCTCIGSLEGSTALNMESAMFRADISGNQSLPFGGLNGGTVVSLCNANATFTMETNMNVEEYIAANSIEIIGGRASLSNHGAEINLKLPN